MITKIQSISLISLIVAIIAVLSFFSGVSLEKSNVCNQEIIDIFINRSNIEYKSLMDLSDRNVLFLDRNKWLILNDEDYANQEESKGMAELRNVYNFEDDISNLNEAIREKKIQCDKYSSRSQWISRGILLLILIQFVLAINEVKRTKRKKSKKERNNH